MARERSTREKEWWLLANIVEFRERITKLDDTALASLSSEIKSAICVTQAQLETKGKDDREWWNRARQALAFMVEKKRMLGRFITEHQAANHARKLAAPAVLVAPAPTSVSTSSAPITSTLAPAASDFDCKSLDGARQLAEYDVRGALCTVIDILRRKECGS